MDFQISVTNAMVYFKKIAIICHQSPKNAKKNEKFQLLVGKTQLNFYELSEMFTEFDSPILLLSKAAEKFKIAKKNDLTTNF